MGGNLVELAQRFVRLSGELDATRDAMKRVVAERSRVRKRKPYAGPAREREAAAAGPTEGASDGSVEETILKLLKSSPGTGTAAIAKATSEIDNGRAVETSSGEGPDRARRRQRRVARAGLTAEEIADLLEPSPVTRCERCIKPLASSRCEATSSARFGWKTRA